MNFKQENRYDFKNLILNNIIFLNKTKGKECLKLTFKEIQFFQKNKTKILDKNNKLLCYNYVLFYNIFDFELKYSIFNHYNWNSTFSCLRCNIKGKRNKNGMNFSELNCERRKIYNSSSLGSKGNNFYNTYPIDIFDPYIKRLKSEFYLYLDFIDFQ